MKMKNLECKFLNFKVIQQNKNNKTHSKLIKKSLKTQHKKNMSLISLIQRQQNKKITEGLPNLPRFNKQFVGISHHLQNKKKQRRKVQEDQRSIANRVIFLQKQQIRAQKKLSKKKTELGKILQTMDRSNYEKQQKQRLRKLRELQLQALRQQNKHRRLFHRQVMQNSKFQLQKQKHTDYSRIKNFIKAKQQQKKQFIYQDLKNKRDLWISMNIQKQKGKKNVDKYYKKKNVQHTLNYLSMIQKQEITKQQKMNTIKHLEQFQTALKKKLQDSTQKVSQVQQIIMKASRTLQPRLNSSLDMNRFLGNSKLSQFKKQRKNVLSGFQLKGDDRPLNLSFQKQFEKEDSTSSEHKSNEIRGFSTERKSFSGENNQEQIQQAIGKNSDVIQMSGFKIIRTTKKKRKNLSNRYKQYQFF